MHPARPSTPSGLRNSARRRPTPSRDPPPAPASAQHHSQTSLPSIRQLHPYLPPSGMSQHLSATGESSNYSYPAPHHYTPSLGQHDQPSSHLSGLQREADSYGAMDSDADDGDQQGPPKKKRRRQALSCTECKRRKIKCDRSQPCAPCTRRGEQAKCQWHIVEPIEKYVTRTEYDDLKARFEHLESLVQRLLPTAQVGMPYYQMGIQSGMPGAPVEAVQSSYSTAGSSSIVYQPLMQPPQNYAQQQHVEPGQAPHRFIKPEGSPRHQHPQSAMGPPSSPAAQQPQPQQPSSHSPSLTRHRPPENKSPSSAVSKSSPFSLASITSPYNPDPQSKNFHAQTLMLGERLRPGSQAPEGPAAPSCGTTITTHTHTHTHTHTSTNTPPPPCCPPPPISTWTPASPPRHRVRGRGRVPSPPRSRCTQ